MEPQKFAAELINRLEEVLRDREAEAKLEERLKRVRAVSDLSFPSLSLGCWGRDLFPVGACKREATHQPALPLERPLHWPCLLSPFTGSSGEAKGVLAQQFAYRWGRARPTGQSVNWWEECEQLKQICSLWKAPQGQRSLRAVEETSPVDRQQAWPP